MPFLPDRSVLLGSIATQRPELVKRLDPEEAAARLINPYDGLEARDHGDHGGMGINLSRGFGRGNWLMLRAGLTEKELSILRVPRRRVSGKNDS